MEATVQSKSDPYRTLAVGLGWFSVGLGLAEVLAPGKLAEIIGVRDSERTRSLLRFYGMRELAAGAGILSQPEQAAWLWSRVGGDLLDLGTLGTALRSGAHDHGRLGAATAAVLGVTALDVICAQELSKRQSDGAGTTHHITQSVLVNRSPEEVYEFWRNFENLPQFMTQLESVRVTGDRRSHWKAKGPMGVSVDWDAETTDDQPGSRIAWTSTENADVYNSGVVRFERAPGSRGTKVTVDLDYAPPGGTVGATFAKMLGKEPGQQVHQDLRIFKQIMEVGEIVRSDASIHTGMHPAQPSAT
jgi:uncharacterized membrane protein